MADGDLKRWYSQEFSLDDGRITGDSDAAVELVQKRYLPWLARWGKPEAQVVIDLGHHVMLGLWKGLIPFLNSPPHAPGALTQGRAVFLRIRRDRYKVAFSFAFSPSQTGCVDLSNCSMWMSSPTKDPVFLKPPIGVWQHLTLFQQALWWVDECEATWQHIIDQANPQALREIEWSSDLSESFWTVAALLGEGTANPRIRPRTPLPRQQIHILNSTMPPRRVFQELGS